MPERKRPTILCLSRSSLQLSQIISHLDQAHYEAIPASSPEAAVAFCASNHVNAVVLDSEFVTEDGWTVTRSFRMVAPQLPIVLLKPDTINKIPGGIDAVAASTELIPGTLRTLLANYETEQEKHEPDDSRAVRKMKKAVAPDIRPEEEQTLDN